MSEYFKPEEFECHCGCGEKDVNPKLVDLLDRIRKSFDKPITIMSGRRCKAHNTKVGGAKNSQHVLGNAADIQVKGVKPDDVPGERRRHPPILRARRHQVRRGQGDHPPRLHASREPHRRHGRRGA